ncbi:hypothetical protein HanOQP8_Chr04g0154581 [Helianthus annuus]|nr:hypothetical protein HanIR_Chr04g0187681 [Helianthus annuus]KAJ0761837.1 hypothetical protein HanOQP8_Chr04g0154581 [Helianthus annuus]
MTTTTTVVWWWCYDETEREKGERRREREQRRERDATERDRDTDFRRRIAGDERRSTTDDRQAVVHGGGGVLIPRSIPVNNPADIVRVLGQIYSHISFGSSQISDQDRGSDCGFRFGSGFGQTQSTVRTRLKPSRLGQHLSQLGLNFGQQSSSGQQSKSVNRSQGQSSSQTRSDSVCSVRANSKSRSNSFNCGQRVNASQQKSGSSVGQLQSTEVKLSQHKTRNALVAR